MVRNRISTEPCNTNTNIFYRFTNASDDDISWGRKSQRRREQFFNVAQHARGAHTIVRVDLSIVNCRTPDAPQLIESKTTSTLNGCDVPELNNLNRATGG